MSRALPRLPPWCALLLVACAGTGAGPSDAQIAVGRKAEPAGAKVFALRCASCHGEHGDAPMAPAVLGPGALRRRELGSADGLARYLRANMPPGPKAGSLSEAEYRAVADYMRRVQAAAR